VWQRKATRCVAFFVAGWQRCGVPPFEVTGKPDHSGNTYVSICDCKGKVTFTS
jgi:hypothetical protein